MGHAHATKFSPLKIAVLTVSDSRTRNNDTSGDYLEEQLLDAGHELVDRDIVVDNIYLIREIISRWIADPQVEVILTTGGTGLTGRDSTPEAIVPLFDKTIEGFGEMFRHVSLEDIGMSTIQSRALAGLANKTLMFCLPGSSGACQTGWEKIIKTQLDIRTRPCNFAQMYPRMDEK
jgi:molybdenum cofactor biosynthesis protein B